MHTRRSLMAFRLPLIWIPTVLGFCAVVVAESEFKLTMHLIDDAIEEGDGQSLADNNGDGRNNLIVATGNGGEVYWYEKSADSGWQKHRIAKGLIEVEGTIAADFNGDGQIEVVVLDQATRDTDKPNVYLAKQTTPDPRGPWAIVVLDAHAPHAQQGIAMDVNHNGRLDFVYSFEGKKDGEGGFYWMENKGGDPLNPAHWTRHEMLQMEGAWWIDANSPKDFNQNGHAGDILVSARAGGRSPKAAKGGIFLLLKPEDPTQHWECITIDDSFPVLHVSSGNLTGRVGERDIVAGACHDSRDTGLFIYDASDHWKRSEVEPAGDWWGTYAYDINGNGRAEIITGCKTDHTLRIYAYDEAAARYLMQESVPFRKPDDQILFDVRNEDGRATGFYVGSDPDGVFWFETK